VVPVALGCNLPNGAEIKEAEVKAKSQGMLAPDDLGWAMIMAILILDKRQK
jgi:hypothetical protein